VRGAPQPRRSRFAANLQRPLTSPSHFSTAVARRAHCFTRARVVASERGAGNVKRAVSATRASWVDRAQVPWTGSQTGTIACPFKGCIPPGWSLVDGRSRRAKYQRHTATIRQSRLPWVRRGGSHS
jgi:hypothetical protein